MEVVVNQQDKRSWVEIDLEQIIRNYEIYKSKLPEGTDVMLVTKADAYGHGDVRVALKLQELGVHMFAVSNIDEAVSLREAGVDGEILILGYTSPLHAKILYEQDLTQAIASEEYASALVRRNLPIKCQFAIDTGMNRIGIDGDNPEECSIIVHRYSKRLKINGIFTHLCVADTDEDENVEFTLGQMRKFKAVASLVKDMNLPYVHCCNSAAGLTYLPKYFDEFEHIGRIVRLGIMLYGLKPDYSNILPEGIHPALTWKTCITCVKKLHKGESVGYGRTFVADHEMYLATIPTGYADGYDRHLSNCGHVIIHGKSAPIVGRICMDQLMADVTDIPEAAMGDVVILLGKSGDVEYNADDMAQQLGTIGYEVLCNISKRVQRFYI